MILFNKRFRVIGPEINRTKRSFSLKGAGTDEKTVFTSKGTATPFDVRPGNIPQRP